VASVSAADVKKVVVACEAGMGSSVMVAKALAKQLKELGIEVTHSPVNRLAASGADLVLCHRSLSGRAKQAVPDLVVIPFDMFLGDLAIASVVEALLSGGNIADS